MKDPNRIARFLWGAALITLPITSFRYFPFMGEGTFVRPLSLYPLALLLPLLIVQALRGKRKLAITGSMILLGAFALAVVAVTSFGLVIDPVPLRGQTYSARAIRALATLIIGIIFFISAAWMNRDEDDMRFTFKWLIAGLCIDIAWSGLQAVTFYTHLLKKEMVTHWQLIFSMRELVRTNRISGMAYEPAWLAGQLSTMYLPVLFASLMTGLRLTRTKWLEPVLLVLSSLLLLATYSRGGILIGFGVAGLMFLFIGREMIRSAWRWFWNGFRSGIMPLLIRLGMIAAVLGVLIGAVLFLSRKTFIRNMWESNASSLNEYLVDINAGARGAYAVGAMAAFDEHPITGVGLGASGFYIYNNLPDWSQTFVPEIARQLSPQNKLYPNPKNFYIRLLAETGLIGFVLFLVFIFSVLGDALSLLKHQNWLRHMGVAALFAWLAIVLYNVTQDSFAVPNIWLIPGILAGLEEKMRTNPEAILHL